MRYCLKQSDTRALVLADRFLKQDYCAMLRAICPGVETGLPDPALPRLERVIVLGDDVPGAALSIAVLDSPQAVLPDENSEGVTPEDVGLMQYTSGTTSFPKGVMLSHDSMLRDAWEAARRMGVGAGDRYFSARPLFHVSGTVLSMFLCMMRGACYLTTPSFEPGEALRIMEEEGCTHTTANDTMFLMMMNHPDFPKRKLKVRGGLAAAAYPVMKQIHDRMGITGISAGYGLSEAAPNVALAPCDDELERRLAGYAFPLPGVEVRIVEPDTGRDRAPGESGEILVRGWGVMKGYYNMPEATARAIDADGWLHTGDLGMLELAGRLLFMDRLKDMFRVGGENVAPADVENWLNQHPAIRHAQVVGVPDPRLREVAAAFVVLKAGASATPEEIIAWCRERMAGFKVPRFVRFVDSFDQIGMTASAKIQRNKLREYALDELGLRPAAT